MKNSSRNLFVSLSVILAAIIAVIALKYSSGFSTFLWNISDGGVWLLPLVVFSSLLDSVHPCSFSILLITIAFLFSLQIGRTRMLAIGSLYIAGIFAAYFGIGIGLLKVLHIFNVPHFMGKIGSAMLIIFGLLNLIAFVFPNSPIKLKMPNIAHGNIGWLIHVVSLPAAFALGLLVGLCQFPCMGGPYLMTIGLLHDRATYAAGFGYLLLYNAILVIPLIAVLWIAVKPVLLEKIKQWRETQMRDVHLWAGIAMIIIGILVMFI